MSSAGSAALRWRVAETVAWCAQHASLHDPKGSLRTAALRPSNLAASPNEWGIFDYEWGTETRNAEAIAAVSTLAERRAEMLREVNVYPDASLVDFAGGRLLIADPEDSDQCGLSDSASHYFIDGLDVPPWDTWVAWIHEDRHGKAGGATPQRPDGLSVRASYLLCWVPNAFVPLVAIGMQVNPVDCLFWAADYKSPPQNRRWRQYDTSAMRGLDVAGLLR